MIKWFISKRNVISRGEKVDKDGFIELMKNLDEEEALHLFRYICGYYAYAPGNEEFIDLVLERLTFIRQSLDN